MTQKELIIEYLKQNGEILPAKMAGFRFMGQMFGSETSKRCREMRKAGLLDSRPEGKFEVFTLKVEPVQLSFTYKIPEIQRVWKL